MIWLEAFAGAMLMLVVGGMGAGETVPGLSGGTTPGAVEVLVVTVPGVEPFHGRPDGPAQIKPDEREVRGARCGRFRTE